jgi:hypothetical protein
MNTYRFPEQNTVFTDKPYTGEFLSHVFSEIFRSPKPVTGFLKVSTSSGAFYFLFFLRSDPYAAGKFTGNKPFNITITDFFRETSLLPPDTLRLSLHETDPVLLKSMLVFLQDEPTAKVPVNLIDLEQVVRQIGDEAADALIVLEKNRLFNFYFFKSGKAALCHLADTSFTPPAELSIDEHMLLYAFHQDPPIPVVHIYRTITTEQAADAEQISRENLLAMVRDHRLPPRDLPAANVAPGPRLVTVKIVGGAQQGETFALAVPCTIGRKECDLVVNDSLVSRRHAVIREIDGQLNIEDLKSTNGTFVNGEEIHLKQISPDDTIIIGETSLTVSG